MPNKILRGRLLVLRSRQGFCKKEYYPQIYFPSRQVVRCCRRRLFATIVVVVVVFFPPTWHATQIMVIVVRSFVRKKKKKKKNSTKDHIEAARPPPPLLPSPLFLLFLPASLPSRTICQTVDPDPALVEPPSSSSFPTS